jgi:hypothetical protein
MVTIDTHWQYHGLQVVRIENDLLCVDVLPELGAKIYNFVHKPSGRNLLWHNPSLPPAHQHFGASFDDSWSGGWDELLPNDVPLPAPDGDMLPDHGEVWAQPAEWEVVAAGSKRAEVRFVTHGRVLPTRFEKSLCLEQGDPFLRLSYSYQNLGLTPFDFLWNIHPALAITPETRLDVPARRGITDPWHATRFPGDQSFEWPLVTDLDGKTVDLSLVEPPESGLADMHYLVGVEAGWYAATDRRAGTGFALSFPTAVFPHVWLFRSLGGWRGLYTLILEASTGYPYDLEVARRNGTCAHLAPGETLSAEVLAIAYSGVASVSRVEPDGRVVDGLPEA